MPAAFDKCIKAGGKVRTQSLSGDRYRHVCTLGGKTFLGHVKRKKRPTSKQVGNAFMKVKT